ncbi:MAG: HAD family phosphatase [Jiangellales bacterium]
MTSDAQPRGLVVDWGGVLTEDVRVAIAMWAQSEGIPTQTMRSAFRRWLGPAEAEREMVNPVHLLERGEIAVAEFEHYLAGEMSSAVGHTIVAEGLLRRMFSYFTHAPAMTSLVWRAHESGIRTALLSNSWGNSYPAQVWDGMFDTVVISGEVGMRKPEPAIYTHTCSQLELAPEQCVFVDDLAHNVDAAAALGMLGVHHVAYETTAAELSALFGRDLTGSRDME